MQYCSTRGGAGTFTAAEAIILGQAPDGGLFVPAEIPSPVKLASLSGAGYRRLAGAILAPFLDGFTREEIDRYTGLAYTKNRFDHPAIAPLHRLDGSLYLLELWHGPTGAFKDMALQLLPHLLKGAAAKTGEQKEMVILVATSGDTGKAALEGFRDVPGTRIIVFYPDRGVSEIQERQMTTQEGDNVTVAAVEGNFDDVQAALKRIFADRKLNEKVTAHGYRFSSANSINWGRLAPQVVYYFSAYLDLLRDGAIGEREPVNFVVPTGNFGNILAGFYARQMGLPVNRLICAANANNVLSEFINTGTYNRNRPFTRTISPSMDILVSSNLERALFELTGRDAGRVRRWMEKLQSDGKYTLDPDTRRAVQDLFWSDFAGDGETVAAIKLLYREHGYLADPHTAVALAVYEKYRAATGDTTGTVILSTASPFKFNRSAALAVLDSAAVENSSEFELLPLLSRETGLPVPPGLRDLAVKPVRHRGKIKANRVKDFVLHLLCLE